MLGNYNTGFSSMSPPPKKPADLSAKDLEEWASLNMYRTNYRDMHKKSPVKNKNYAIPGYTGHIPGTSADTNYGKRFAVIAKEQFRRDKYLPSRTNELFPQRPLTLSPMERTLGKFGGGLGDEHHTVSRFHGKSTIPMTHPNYTETDWTSNYRKFHVPQEKLRPQIFRKTDVEFWKNSPESDRNSTKASGFVQNSTYFDGHGWEPIKILHGDMNGSEYRGRFNPDVSFHPLQLKQNIRSLPKKQLIY